MQNSVKVSVAFDFKGVRHEPSALIDLDQLVGGDEEAVYALLARENGIGAYSYEFEVLTSSPLVYSDAAGLAAEFLAEGDFDWQGFARAVEAQSVQAQLEEIACEHLGVEDLAAQPNLAAALLAAYRRGSESTERGC